MHLNIKLELVEDGQHVALVDRGEVLPTATGFFTQEAFAELNKAVGRAYAEALLAFAEQVGAERVLAEQVAAEHAEEPAAA